MCGGKQHSENKFFQKRFRWCGKSLACGMPEAPSARKNKLLKNYFYSYWINSCYSTLGCRFFSSCDWITSSARLFPRRAWRVGFLTLLKGASWSYNYQWYTAELPGEHLLFAYIDDSPIYVDYVFSNVKKPSPEPELSRRLPLKNEISFLDLSLSLWEYVGPIKSHVTQG